MNLVPSQPCKQWVYLLQTPKEKKELLVNSEEVIKNADDEVDVPLDSVLKKYGLTFEDLFIMKVREIKLIEINNNCKTILRSISFKYLRYYHQ